MTTLTITGTGQQIHTGDNLAGVTDIVFNTTGPDSTRAIFNTSQFTAPFPKITGDAFSNFLLLQMTSSIFSVAPMKFQNWSANDGILILGTAGNDTITGSLNFTTGMAGGPGADILKGGNANDGFAYFTPADIVAGESVTGGKGLDVLSLTANGGIYDFSAVDLSGIEGLGVSDSIVHTVFAVFTGQQVGAGKISNISGAEDVTVSLAINGATVDLSQVAFTIWTGNTITVNGTAGADKLTGSNQFDIVHGAAGNDTLKGAAGDDTLDGGTENDTASYAGNATGVTVSLALQNAPQDTLGAGMDTLMSIENLIGSSHNDTLTGDDAVNVITGGLGLDLLSGGSQTDTFDYNKTADSKRGANHDVIQDFGAGTGGLRDIIDVHDIDANTHSKHNQNFKWIGAQKFHHKSGELHVLTKVGFYLVEADTNGDGKADFQLEVHSATALQKGDFHF